MVRGRTQHRFLTPTECSAGRAQAPALSSSLPNSWPVMLIHYCTSLSVLRTHGPEGAIHHLGGDSFGSIIIKRSSCSHWLPDASVSGCASPMVSGSVEHSMDLVGATALRVAGGDR